MATPNNGTITTSSPTPPSSSSTLFTSTTPSSTSSTSSIIPTSTSTTPLPSTSSSKSVIFSTSIFTAPPHTSTLPNGGVTTVFTTSTDVVTKAAPTQASTGNGAAATSGAAGLAAPSDQGSSGPPTTTIAVAVVVPIVCVILLVLLGIWLWRRRKGRRNAEEMRRKEMEEYGFNPNNDPTLATVTSTNGDEPSTMRERDGGYRGWGTTTSTANKASTTMSSNPGMARSDSGGRGGQPPEGYSGSPPASGDEVGALAAPAASGNRGAGVHRGPSNASSAYSGANYSDGSGDAPLPGGSPQEYGGYMHPDESIGTANYGDGGWAAQPIIKDVSARRNTRIENPSVIPHQGGIAQNF